MTSVATTATLVRVAVRFFMRTGVMADDWLQLLSAGLLVAYRHLFGRANNPAFRVEWWAVAVVTAAACAAGFLAIVGLCGGRPGDLSWGKYLFCGDRRMKEEWKN